MTAWTLAECSRLRAFAFAELLVIVADGQKPTPCHVVKVVQSPLAIYPPEFLVEWEQPKPCADLITDYHVVSDPTPWTSGANSVKVAHLKHGETVTEHVEVTVVRTVQTAGGEIPIPFAAVRGGDLPVPLGTHAEGEVRRPFDTATGYSAAFSIQDAFNDAIKRLPTREPAHPDELERIEVKLIGAEFGGIAGFHHVFVEVSRITL